jgi:hypothetical protein
MRRSAAHVARLALAAASPRDRAGTRARRTFGAAAVVMDTPPWNR